MIEDLRAMALFVKVIQHGSFSAAAREMNLSPSVVSHHLARLEDKYGTALLYRSTRKISLTSHGEKVYRHASHMLESAGQALNVLNKAQNEPTGTIRISLSVSLLHSPLMQALSDFSQSYQKIHLDISASDQRVDMTADGIDLALRVGHMPDSNLKSKRLGSIERRLVCSPGYALKQANPVNPKDLADWDWVKMKMMPPWRDLTGPDGQQVRLEHGNRIETDNIDAMYALCLAGAGIAAPPAQMAQPDIDAGRLVEILPGWRPSSFDYYAVWHANQPVDSTVSLLVQKLTTYQNPVSPLR